VAQGISIILILTATGNPEPALPDQRLKRVLAATLAPVGHRTCYWDSKQAHPGRLAFLL
jgi:hypothetical protein